MPRTKAPTKPSPLKLSDQARYVVAPKGSVSTGWPAVRDKCSEFGISFRTWQEGAGRLILAKRADGKYAATIGGTGLSIPRQVGKTFLVGAIVFALCLLRPNLTVIWTSHRLRTSGETFGKMQAFAKRARIKPHVFKIVLGSGEEEIRFRNGSRILFGARERGFGRGFDEVDVLIFDEAQILSDAALDDMIPATNQSRQPTGALLLFMGTPPKPSDPSEAFTRMRTDALGGEDDDTGWLEFGADPDFRPTPAPAALRAADWKQVAKANPSFPDDTPREAILRMRKKLGPESFLREGLGIWDDLGRPLIMPNWPLCATSEPQPPIARLGVAVDLDRVWVSVGAYLTDGTRHHLAAVSVMRDGHPITLRRRLDQDRALVISEVKRIQDEQHCSVVLDRKGRKDSGDPLEQDLVNAGVRVTPASLDDFVNGCTDVFDKVAAKEIEHGDYPELNDAVAAAGWRKVGPKRRVWAATSGDISMLDAVTLAYGAPDDTSVYEDRGMVTL